MMWCNGIGGISTRCLQRHTLMQSIPKYKQRMAPGAYGGGFLGALQLKIF